MKLQQIICVSFSLLLLSAIFLNQFAIAGNIEAQVHPQTLSLEETSQNYIVTTSYYQAYLSKISPKGLIKHLYIKKQGMWSGDIVYQLKNSFGLGFLEGVPQEGRGENSNNDFGLQHADPTFTVQSNARALSNTASIFPAMAKIKAQVTYNNMDFSETWTFWSDVPYFMSEAVVEEKLNKRLVNQYQFAWMINNTWSPQLYGTDEYGNIVNITSERLWPLSSEELDTYPWINWQFMAEGVSLGLIFVYTNDPWAIYGDSGDWSFEYQTNFYASGGSSHTVSTQGMKRELTTLYYTTDSLTNDNIRMLARTEYLFASLESLGNPTFRGSRVLSDLYAQNKGIGTALLNSPYFIVRQNSQWSTRESKGPQWETEISPPFYLYPEASGDYHLVPAIYYSLGYNNGTANFEYGTITQAEDFNNGAWMYAQSSDNKVAYNTTFQTWSDSDKLRITGYAKNVSSSTHVKQVYVDITVPKGQYIEVEAAAQPTSAITSALSGNDNLWTNYTGYGWGSGKTLIYNDATEDVPILKISAPTPLYDTYRVLARVRGSSTLNLTYYYSWDNVTWNSFTGYASQEAYEVYLGTRTFSDNTAIIYLNDNDTGGVNYWHGWDYIKLLKIPQLDSATYDIQYTDQIYGRMGISVQISQAAENVTFTTSGLRIYLYNQTTAQNLTGFQFHVSFTLWNHKGWLASPAEITALHAKEALTYNSHKFTKTSRSLYFYDRSVGTRITQAEFTGEHLRFTISATSGTTSVTKVYVGDQGNATEVWGATSWSYNSTSKILTINKIPTAETSTIDIFWRGSNPASSYAIKVALGITVVSGMGALIVWVWRRKNREGAMKHIQNNK